MLIEFTVENFGSIKEPVTFSMLASADKSSHPENTFVCEALGKKENRLLKFASIHGANASGKTNLFKALEFIEYLVLTSHKNQKGNKIPVNPFKLDLTYLSKPSSFDIMFVHNNIKYNYGVKLDAEKIHEEYLYYWPKGRKIKLFERWNVNEFDLNLNSGSKLSEKEKLKQEIYLEETLDNILFLSQATKLKNEVLSEVFDWFDCGLDILTNHTSLNSLTTELIKIDPDAQNIITKYLNLADFGISTFNIKESLFDKQIKEKTEQIKNDLIEIFTKYGVARESIINKQYSILLDEKRYKVKTYHKGKNFRGEDIEVEFDITDESDGTQKYYGIVGSIILALRLGNTIFIDEMDLRLHPLLTKSLISLFNDPEINKKNAQLVFTTHDINLLDLKLFRRDQIWFTEKDEYGETNLYSLDDFSERKDIDLQTRYLQGRYGAIPFINKDILLCGDEK